MALVTNLILTLTEQKLIKWSLKLYMLPSFTFLKTFFFSISKNVTFDVFCSVAYVFANFNYSMMLAAGRRQGVSRSGTGCG